MSTREMNGERGRVPSAGLGGRALTVAYWTIGVALAVAVVALPINLVPYYTALIVVAALFVFCVNKPIMLIYVLIVTSALVGLLRVFESLPIGVSLSGVRWAAITAITTSVLAVNFERLRVAGWLMPFFAFALWAVLRFILTPLGVTGAKDLVFYLLPPLVALYTVFVIQTTPRPVPELIRNLLLASVVLPVIIYLVLMAFGVVRFTAEGPLGPIGPRAVALYLLVVLALALAVNRYGESSSVRTAAGIAATLALITIMVTLSRTAAVTGLALVLFSRARPRYPARLIFRLAGVVVLTVLLLWSVPAFRERSFHRVEEGLVSSLEHFNTMGRAVMWSLTAANALQSPVIGWGPGSARLMLVRERPKGDETEHHPHNEYLQTFHDLGAIGLLLLMVAWGKVVIDRWRAWIRSEDTLDRNESMWNLAALLASGVVLVTSVTDNTLHYADITTPVFMIIAIASHLSAGPVVGRYAANGVTTG